jgi:hypothetical protein
VSFVLGGGVAAAIGASVACSDGAARASDAQTSGDAAPGAMPSPADAGSEAAPTLPPRSVFVAQAPDFTGFCRWSSADAMPARDSPFGVHGVQAMKVYWNAPPPHAADEFPVGTIVLKESEQADASERIVFAMVKRQPRGAGYNTGGADGWEWFSLQDQGDCTAAILWRGPQAPILTTYSDLLTGDCNGCHGGIADNDYVWDTALQLSRF